MYKEVAIMWKNKESYVDYGGVFGLSIIKHVTLQKIVAHDFRYDPRITKLPLYTALRNIGEWRYSSSHSSRLQMVSGQLHVPVALSPGEMVPMAIPQEAGPFLRPIWTFWKIKKCLTVPGKRTTIPALSKP